MPSKHGQIAILTRQFVWLAAGYRVPRIKMEQTPSKLGTYSPSPEDEYVFPAHDPFEGEAEESANSYETNPVPEMLRLYISELPANLATECMLRC
jgi:hypothetical protein